jgi:homospermidine synthase
MPDNRQTFSSRNDWHFAVAEAHPLATVRTRVLVETRVIDGVEVAGWDHSTNTGWVASNAPLDEAAKATPHHLY